MKLTQRPDSGYAWVIVGLGACSIAVQTGILWSGALFLTAIEEDTGWSRATVAGAFSLFVFGNGLWASLLGWLVRARGARQVMPVAAGVLAIGLVVLSRTADPLLFSTVILLLVSPGAIGVGSLPNYTVVQSWFRRRRGLALGLVDAGSGLGLAVLPPISQALILNFGWRGAYIAQAGLVLVLIPLHLLLQRRAPLEPAAEATGRPGQSRLASVRLLFGSGSYWIVLAGLMSTWFVTTLVVVHHAAYLRDQAFDPTHIAATFAMLGSCGILGRIIFGWMSDRFGVLVAYLAVVLCAETGLACLVLAGSTRQTLPLLFFAVLFGLSMGVGTILFARRISELFGSQMFGLAMGLAFSLGSVGGALGSAGAGAAFELTGTYLSSFAAAALAATFSLGCMWLLRPKPVAAPVPAVSPVAVEPSTEAS